VVKSKLPRPSLYELARGVTKGTFGDKYNQKVSNLKLQEGLNKAGFTPDVRSGKWGKEVTTKYWDKTYLADPTTGVTKKSRQYIKQPGKITDPGFDSSKWQ
jgi:hypothetical protein